MNKNMLEIPGILLAMTAMAGLFAGTASGRVFEDKDGNGVFSTGDVPLPGMMVSDGLTVMKTGAGGAYEFEFPDSQRSVFIHVPAQYRCRRWFYRLPDERGPFDFAFTPGPVNDTVRFAQIADEECAELSGGWYEALIALAAAERLDFVVCTGDLRGMDGIRMHAEKFTPEAIGTDVFIAVGNHDLVPAVNNRDYASLLYPYYYSFERGGILFFSAPMTYGETDRLPYNQTDFGDYVRQILTEFPADKPIVVFGHDLLNYSDPMEIPASGGALNLSAHNLRAWIFGHWHATFVRRAPSGSLYCATSNPNKGGIDHSPSCIRLISVGHNGEVVTAVRCTPISRYAAAAPPVRAADGGLRIMATAYDTAHDVQTASVRLRDAVSGEESRIFELAPGSTRWQWNGDIPAFGTPGGTGSLELSVTWADGKVSRLSVPAVFPLPAGTHDVPTAECFNFQGSASHNGFFPAARLSRLEPVWAADLGGESFLGTPLVAGGMVFAATADLGSELAGGVTALDAATGKVLWRHRSERSIRNAMAGDGDRIFFLDSRGDIVALNAADGRELWRDAALSEGLPTSCGGVVYADGAVYGGKALKLRKLCVSGPDAPRVAWRNSAWDEGEGTCDTPTLVGGVVLTGAFWRGFYLSSATGGGCLRKFNQETDRFHSGSFAAVDNRVYYSDGARVGYFSVPDGRPVMSAAAWELQSSGAPVAAGRLVLATTADSGLVALDRETLEVKWIFSDIGIGLFDTSPYLWRAKTAESSPVAAGDTVWFGANDGWLYGVALEDGTLRQKFQLGAPVISSPAVAGEWLYVTDYAGRLFAFHNQPE
ncbi:MAG: PQQ-binding-like beta-propeller repeat protein [Victivallaceae bacterium]|nr:PQQ-binding-like beta-propeller repeat protein [Victivallaceae bacterium]